jgi:hypothetical protein
VGRVEHLRNSSYGLPLKRQIPLHFIRTTNPGTQNQSRPLPVVVDRQHLAADRLGRVGGEEHRERRDVLGLDHRLDRLRGHRLGAHLLDRPAADLGAAGEDAIAPYSAVANSVRGVTIVTMASGKLTP